MIVREVMVIVALTIVVIKGDIKNGGDSLDPRILLRTGDGGDNSNNNDDNNGIPKEDYFLSVNQRSGVDGTNKNAVVFGAGPTVTPVDYDEEPSPEERLYRHLFGRGYVKNVRPSRDPNKSVIVRVGMCVMMIEDLIEREQMMIMAACAKMLWDDHRLTWDPEKFNNITWMAVSNQQVWFPDIVIVNSPDPAALTRKITNVGLSHRGELGYFPSGRLFTRCNLVITFFPFDWQQCEVRFESWIYPTKYLELDLFPGDDTIDVKEHYANYQWTIKGHRIQSEIVSYDGHNFSSITIVFIFRRKSLYFSLYFIFPELLLAVLQTLSHTLPVEHPGRMTMLTALFIGSSVTHAGVAAHIPKSSDTMSLLQVYMTLMSINLVFSLLVTFLMLYTVLRYPNAEPSFKSMIIAFFSVVWPSLRNPPPPQPQGNKVGNKGPQQRNIGEMPENAISHYIRPKAPHFQLPPSTIEGGQQKPQNEAVNEWQYQPSATTTPTMTRQVNGPHKGEYVLTVRLSNLPPSSNNCETVTTATASCTPRHQLVTGPVPPLPIQAYPNPQPSPCQPVYSPGMSVFSSNRGEAPDRFGEGGDVASQYMSYQRCITSSPPVQRHNLPPMFQPSQSPGNNEANRPPPHPSTPQSSLFRRTPAAMMSSGGESSQDENNSNITRGSHEAANEAQASRIRRRQGGSALTRSALCPIERPPLPPHSSSLKKHQETSEDRSGKHHHKQEEHGNRNRQATDEDAQELKRRWLVYCVALDKIIMYGVGMLNVVVPVILFTLTPVLNEFFFMSQSTYQPYQPTEQ